MLQLNQIRPGKGATKKAKRVGRGRGSGSGCTAGYGNNGARARSGAINKSYFEGGQTPLTRRIPKRGFNNIFKKYYQLVNLGNIDKIDFSGKEIDIKVLFEMGLIHNICEPVKILGNGELSKALTIKADAFSKNAREKIEKMKGKAEVITSV